MLLVIIIVLYLLIAFSIIISLLIYGVRPAKTLAWLLAVFTIPVGGILLYLLLGRNRRKNKLFKLRHDYQHGFDYSANTKESKINIVDNKTTKLVYQTSGYPLTHQNQVTILKDGQETFESIFLALTAAKAQIHIQYYIFEDGILADKLLNLFKIKIKEGVKIRLLYDGIGSYSLSKKYIKGLKKIGVEVYQFLPFRFGRFLASANYRNHRKIIVIDSLIGFTGGINISDKYLKGDKTLGQWHDTHVKVMGEAAYLLDTVFISDWYLASGNRVKSSIQNIDKPALNKRTNVQIVPSGPDDDFAIMEKVYFSIINNAEKYVYIINPYIIPNHAILQSLQSASLSGVEVRLLLSSTTDIKLVDWCVRAYFESYLKARIKVYLYPSGFLHSKVVLCDDHLMSIGTANIDDRSLQQNYEVNALIYDDQVCKKMKKDFLSDCDESIQLDYAEFQNRSWLIKVREGFAKLLSPLL